MNNQKYVTRSRNIDVDVDVIHRNKVEIKTYNNEIEADLNDERLPPEYTPSLT